MKKTTFRWPKIRVDWEDTPPPNPAPTLPPPAPSAIEPDAPSERESNTAHHQPAAKTPPVQTIKKRSALDYLLGTNRPPKPPRSLTARLFGLRIGQFLNLFLWSVVIGGAMKLTNFNPLKPQFNASETAGNVWQQGWSAFAWIVQTSWKPALTGAMIVLPIWFAWRLISLPFRR